MPNESQFQARKITVFKDQDLLNKSAFWCNPLLNLWLVKTLNAHAVISGFYFCSHGWSHYFYFSRPFQGLNSNKENKCFSRTITEFKDLSFWKRLLKFKTFSSLYKPCKPWAFLYADRGWEIQIFSKSNSIHTNCHFCQMTFEHRSLLVKIFGKPS